MDRKMLKAFLVFAFLTIFGITMYINNEIIWKLKSFLYVPAPDLSSDDFDRLLTIQCQTGRLGNRMFFYAVLYGLSRLNNRSGYVQVCNIETCNGDGGFCDQKTLNETFKLSLPVKPNLPQNLHRPHHTKKHIQFPNDYNIPTSANIITGPHPNSVTHFLHVRNEIRKEFEFQDVFQKKAEAVLTKIRSKNPKATLVGVHVRRDDYLKHLVNNRVSRAPLGFYEFGMNYYRRRFGKVAFVITSDDLEWGRKNFRGTDLFFLNGSSAPAEDLAVLSKCNHSLFDYGTYGFWGAFLAGGEAMYFADGITYDQMYSGIMTMSMYPPEWWGISMKILEAMSDGKC